MYTGSNYFVAKLLIWDTFGRHTRNGNWAVLCHFLQPVGFKISGNLARKSLTTMNRWHHAGIGDPGISCKVTLKRWSFTTVAVRFVAVPCDTARDRNATQRAASDATKTTTLRGRESAAQPCSVHASSTSVGLWVGLLRVGPGTAGRSAGRQRRGRAGPPGRPAVRPTVCNNPRDRPREHGVDVRPSTSYEACRETNPTVVPPQGHPGPRISVLHWYDMVRADMHLRRLDSCTTSNRNSSRVWRHRFAIKPSPP